MRASACSSTACLEVGDLSEAERRAIDARLAPARAQLPGRRCDDATADAVRAGRRRGRGGGPVARRPASKHMEFIALGRRPGPGHHGVRRRRGRESADALSARGDAFGAAGGLELPQRPPARPHAGTRPRPRSPPSSTSPAANWTRPPPAWSRTAWPPGAARRAADRALIVRGRANLLHDPAARWRTSSGCARCSTTWSRRNS